MKRWMFAAAVLVLSVKAQAADLRNRAFEQAATLAAGQDSPVVYDGARTLPAVEQFGMSAAPTPSPAAAPSAAFTAPAHESPARIDDVPMPQNFAVVPRPAPRADARPLSTRRLNAPLGALLGLAAGFSLSFGLSKALA
ncbi:MAG: hypothetical protein HKL90_03820 [Elusimicrobia bacterium]|nr:hypothetical protein [Elusimicrobiota bacterium]